ncbi:MAG: hypothetical protein A4S12_07075 [Proteobacteria bacterium SG_bin5]|nr:hypothetical protein [Sphingomonas sp.]OQW42094.1 MAG: hypothetical protein A4S12_07075 [Proteobacteria bacterium SG_bin5]
MQHHRLFDLIEAAIAVAAGITPAALGASVSLAYERGLTWGDRFGRLLVGIVVSYFTTRVVDAMWLDDPFLLQAVSFTLGMIAYKATPPIAQQLTDIVVGLPALIRAKYFPPHKDDAQKGGDQ